MRTLKILFATLVTSLFFTGCNVVIDDINDPYYASLEDIITTNDIWYIDYNKTIGNGDDPFLSKAFTISFLNGNLYANNNLVGIGSTGNGYGIKIGNYDTFNGLLEIDHQLDGYYSFDVVQLNANRLKLIDNYNNVTYFLEGYQKYNFDFDFIFYDNIEYFLQEYDVWEKTGVSQTGAINEFDNENFLAFTPENITTFYSSKDEIGTNIADILWDYEGTYVVDNVQGYDNLKILTLNYGSSGNEEFELTVLDDATISLYHNASGTTYEFSGNGYIQYLKSSSSKKSVRNDGRKRTKITRETKIKRNLK